MRRRLVKLLDLFRQTDTGVELPVDPNTRAITLSPTASAMPVEIWTDSLAGAGAVKDGTLNVEPTTVLVPGGRLQLRDGVKVVTVRPIPGFSAGVGWNKSLPEPLEELDRSRKDWDNGDVSPAAPVGSDSTTLSVVKGNLCFTFDCDTLENCGSPGQRDLLPAVARLAALMPQSGSVPRFAATTQPGTSSWIIPPWATIPLEIARRYTRMRLRVVVGAAYTLVSTATQVPAIFGVVNNLIKFGGLAMGAYCNAPTAVGSGAQNEQLGSQVLEIDCGSPAELFSYAAGLSSSWLRAGRLEPQHTFTVPASYRAEWLLDHGESHRGRILEARSTLTFDVAATRFESVCVFSAKGGTLLTLRIDNAGTDAEIRVQRLDGSGNLTLVTAADSTTLAPIVDQLPHDPTGAFRMEVALPSAGNFLVSIYGGSDANCQGQLEAREVV